MSYFTGESSGSTRVFRGVYNETSGGELTMEYVQACEGSVITKLLEPLNEENWMGWREWMRRVLQLCGILAYVEEKILIPEDMISAKNWNLMTTMLK